MKCSKLYVIKGKRFTVHWCGVALVVLGMAAFVILERMYGPW